MGQRKNPAGSTRERGAPRGRAGTADLRALRNSLLCRLLDSALEVLLYELGAEHHFRIVLGGVLDLLEVVQPAVLVDPVDRRDQPHRLLRARVEMLMNGVRRYV